MSKKIHINNAQNIIDYMEELGLKHRVFIKSAGAWQLMGEEYKHVVLDMHLCNTLADTYKLQLINEDKGGTLYYRLVRTNFGIEKTYYRQLLQLFKHEPRYFALIDVYTYLQKFGFDIKSVKYNNVKPAFRAVVISKGAFELYIPYWGTISMLLNKGKFFKILCQNVCALYLPKNIYPYSVDAAPRFSYVEWIWRQKFDKAAEKVLEWSKRKNHAR